MSVRRIGPTCCEGDCEAVSVGTNAPKELVALVLFGDAVDDQVISWFVAASVWALQVTMPEN